MKQKQTTSNQGFRSATRARAFTLVELLVTLAVLALLGATLAPTLSRTSPNSQATQCLYNLRQLAAAGQMYAEENNDKLAVSLHGAPTLGGTGDPTWGVAWAQGWQDWGNRSDNTNVALLIERKYAKLAPYLNGAANLYQCPADKYISSYQRALGWSRRARSYSGNIGVGSGNAETGPWDSVYKHVIKVSDLLYPSPAETFVLLEEHPDSVNDAAFFSPHQTAWIDIPSTLHNGGATAFSFADGHVELHRWQASLAAGRARQIHFTDTDLSAVLVQFGDADLHWVAHHTQRVSTNSF